MVVMIITLPISCLALPGIYKVYLNPSSPSITLPPLAALLFALQNFKFNINDKIIIKPAETIHATMPKK